MQNRLRLVVLLSAVSLAWQAAADEVTTTFAVEEMNCGLCPVTVRKAMENVEGVIDAKVNYHRKIATVTYDDDQTTAERIAKASTDIGYPATPKTATNE